VDFEAAFNQIIRDRLREHADRAWEVVKKFADHGIGMDAVFLLERGLRLEKLNLALDALQEIWVTEVQEKRIPSLSEMSEPQEELLANVFSIASLRLQRF
jgi:hypothetical protein